MRFEYRPQHLDDWPKEIVVEGIEAGEEIGEGEIRVYEPNWKHQVACGTIRRQRERIAELETQHLNAVDDCRRLEVDMKILKQRQETFRLAAERAYKIALDMWEVTPAQYVPIEYGTTMEDVRRLLRELGSEVE